MFDPTGGDVERGGSRNVGPDADNISHMPPDVVDGNVDETEWAKADEDTATQQIAEAEAEREQKRNPDATGTE
jgi:hypothetical protein